MRSQAIFPSIQNWATPRTSEVLLTTENCMLVLPHKIRSINKVLVNADSIKVGIDLPSHADYIPLYTHTHNLIFLLFLLKVEVVYQVSHFKSVSTVYNATTLMQYLP